MSSSPIVIGVCASSPRWPTALEDRLGTTISEPHPRYELPNSASVVVCNRPNPTGFRPLNCAAK